MGPPAATPYWFCLCSGTVAEKKLRAFSFSFRRNSQALPWISLVPDFETTFTCEPAFRPYSAEKFCA